MSRYARFAADCASKDRVSLDRRFPEKQNRSGEKTREASSSSDSVLRLSSIRIRTGVTL